MGTDVGGRPQVGRPGSAAPPPPHAGATDGSTPGPPVSTRWATLPNALSALRLIGVPIFVYLVVVAQRDLLALGVLVLSGFSDYLDGKVARAWGQISRVGQLLDPLADRLYVFAAVVTFAMRDIVPWWLAGALILRDALLTATLPVLRGYGFGPLPVHFLGKAATFNLLSAFPLLLLSGEPGLLGSIAAPFAWAFALWGVGLYWWAAILYLVQFTGLIRSTRARPASEPVPEEPEPSGPAA
jgi:cardiolipin synthase